MSFHLNVIVETNVIVSMCHALIDVGFFFGILLNCYGKNKGFFA